VPGAPADVVTQRDNRSKTAPGFAPAGHGARPSHRLPAVESAGADPRQRPPDGYTRGTCAGTRSPACVSPGARRDTGALGSKSRGRGGRVDDAGVAARAADTGRTRPHGGRYPRRRTIAPRVAVARRGPLCARDVRPGPAHRQGQNPFIEIAGSPRLLGECQRAAGAYRGDAGRRSCARAWTCRARPASRCTGHRSWPGRWPRPGTGDRATVGAYLREAAGAAGRLGTDGNYLWTAFGPSNVLF
jgi:hypothetical protein